MDMVNVKINGEQYTVPAGSTILEAARYAGIHIPTLCYQVLSMGPKRLVLTLAIRN